MTYFYFLAAVKGVGQRFASRDALAEQWAAQLERSVYFWWARFFRGFSRALARVRQAFSANRRRSVGFAVTGLEGRP